MSETDVPPPQLRIRMGRISLSGIVLLGVFACYGALAFLNSPPSDFPAQQRIVIAEGSGLSAISNSLADAHVVRSRYLFRAIITLYGKQSNLRAGSHLFAEPLSTFGVARSFIEQTSGIPPVKVTIPEGATLGEFDAILATALPQIEPGDIVDAVQGQEGILFPDTYLIEEDWSAERIVTLLKETFAEKLTRFEDTLGATSLSREEVITLASIVEKEGNDAESMKLVSGILRARLEIDMPLQTDATLFYELGKTSAELTADDLLRDSPYNTYRHRGLPPTPICSPGLMAIDSVLNPTPSEYLYYLTDAEGVFHYARTFDEHKDNKALYLR